MDRRKFLIGSSVGLAASSAAKPAASLQSSCDLSQPAGRNVLLVIADDQGLDAGCYGGIVKTPNLDALAAQGTLFTQGYATVSSCSSSRSVLYTGLYSHANSM
jgi:N-sulfoglucosamine sulfohydrolase